MGGKLPLWWRVPVVSLSAVGLVLGAAFAVALAHVPRADAYVGPNPVATDWSGVWDLMVTPSAEEAESGGLSDEAKTILWRARIAAGTMPAPSRLGELALGASTLDIGWKVTRTAGAARWLHLSGDYGTNTKTEGQASNSLYLANKPFSWAWVDVGDPVHGGEGPGTWIAPVSGWYLRYRECADWSSGCTPSGYYSALGTDSSTPYPSGTCSRTPGATGDVVYNNLTTSLEPNDFLQVISWTFIHTGVTALPVCYGYMSEEQFFARTTIEADEEWDAQTVDATTSSHVIPSDPGSGSGTAALVRAALLSGDPSIDDEIGALVDGDWDGQPDSHDLLLAFMPELRFHTEETYRPSKASLATDTYTTDSPAHANHLELLGSTIASANHADAEDNLSLDYLAGEANDEYASGEYINEPKFIVDQTLANEIDTAPLDYNMMLSEHPGEYDNFVYGRVIIDSGGSEERIVQYWFYYYYNQWQYLGEGDHEGDWEWVQIRLDQAGVPVSAAFGQHGNGESCAWSDVQTADDTLVVWPAVGSHANYFHPGTYGVDEVPGPFDGDDETATAISYFQDDLTLIDETDTENWGAWLEWPGRWGASGDPAGASSPKSPGHQSAWEDPFEWHENADETGESCNP